MRCPFILQRQRMKTVLFDYPAQRTKPYLFGAGSFSHPVPPPASGSGTDMLNRKRSTRLTMAVREHMGIIAKWPTDVTREANFPQQ